MKSFIYFLLLMTLFLSSSCLKDELTAEKGECENSYYSREIKPVFRTYCAVSGCHVEGAQSPNLSRYTEIFSNKSKIKSLVENPSNSDPDAMPPDAMPQLSTEQIVKIINWIDAGAIANGCD